MPFQLGFTEEAAKQYDDLRKSKHLVAQFKAETKALRMLAEDPRHPGLQTHAYASIRGPGGAKVWEACAQQLASGAYRIFWSYYPPKTDTITILAITPHP